MLLRVRPYTVPSLIGAFLIMAMEALAAPQPDVSLLVAYYSRSGNTRTMAEAVAEGARGAGDIRVLLRSVDEVTAEELSDADGLVLGSPTYFANMAGPMKQFIDDWAFRFRVNLVGKVGGAFATGGSQSGGRMHVITSLLLAMLNNGVIVAGPVVDRGQSRLSYPGASALAPPSGESIAEAELDEARALGRRLADLVLQRTRGAQQIPR